MRPNTTLSTLTIAIASVALLAACGAPSGPASEPDEPSPSASADSGQSAADLEYGLFYDESMLDDWASARDSLAENTAAFEADCTIETANDASTECSAALFDLLREVNGVKQLWLTFDNSEWDDSSLTGLAALKPTRDATLVASDSGSAWSGSCSTSFESTPECVTLAEQFLTDVKAVNSAFAAWPK